MDQLNQHLSHRLKQLRNQRNWSLTQAAEHTGVSKAMLGQIERGESSPTVATLWKIATGFNVAFSVFIDDASEQPLSVVQRYADLPVFSQENAEMRVLPLFPFDKQLGFDMFVIDLAPGTLSESSAHEQGVIEHVIVIEGQLELRVDGVWHQLAAGEALRFQADHPHSYRNVSQHNVRLHDLIHYPHGVR